MVEVGIAVPKGIQISVVVIVIDQLPRFALPKE